MLKKVYLKRFAALKQLLLELEDMVGYPVSIDYIDACYLISVSEYIENYELFLIIKEGQKTPRESLSQRLKYTPEGTRVFGHEHGKGIYWLIERAGDKKPPQYQLPIELVKEREDYKNGLPLRDNFSKPLKQPIRIQEKDKEKIKFLEGEEIYRIHRQRERNQNLIEQAKNIRKASDPKLHCDVCGFSFVEKYGYIGDGFIEAHHILPLSELDSETEISIDDLAMVCSNCHKMLHRFRPLITIATLKQLVQSK